VPDKWTLLKRLFDAPAQDESMDADRFEQVRQRFVRRIVV
jgi:hypothetical protein